MTLSLVRVPLVQPVRIYWRPDYWPGPLAPRDLKADAFVQTPLYQDFAQAQEWWKAQLGLKFSATYRFADIPDEVEWTTLRDQLEHLRDDNNEATAIFIVPRLRLNGQARIGLSHNAGNRCDSIICLRGDNVLSPAFRWWCHESGHDWGLGHGSSDGDSNLMHENSGGSLPLTITEAQKNQIRGHLAARLLECGW